MDETYDLLAENATVTTCLPILTARFAKQRPTGQGRADGLTTITVPQVLFICVHNAGRSQIAAAPLAHHAFGKVSVRSAGSKPTGTTDAPAELGVELTEAFPKPLTDEVVRAADVVVTVRDIRGDIDRRVRGLLSELLQG
ncbi:hypothetical protein [Lentzea sp. NPDC004782]|uniref:arsenate reductase/protein-tyrosine-phosphatase family protein n=1 Tax=Lentzea sp. NPDC004782 TaxID=3154458 RepID=UPI0033A75F5A